MNEIAVPPEVSVLLEPISKDSPVGTDPEMNAEYIGLEAEMSKMGDVNYEESSKLAQEILKNQAKHLKVAAWLSLAWLRTEGISGFKNGSVLILELLTKYGSQLLPENPAQFSKAAQYISKEKRFQLSIQKLELNQELSKDIPEIIQTINAIGEALKKVVPDSPTELTTLINALQEKAKSGGAKEEPETKTENDSAKAEKIDTSETETEAAEEMPDEKAEPVPEKKTDDSEQGVEATASPPEEKEIETGTGSETPAPAEEAQYEIPSEVADLLEDISSSSPTGEDVENSSDQDVMVVYMNLETEISKYSDNDYEQCMHWARQILQEHSKHLRVAVWFFISWFRKETLTGFTNGLILITELLKRYGEKLFPENVKQKSKIIQMINNDTRIKIIEKIECNLENAQIFIEIGQIYAEFQALCEKLFTEVPPKLTQITEIIEEKIDSAKSMSKPSPAAATEEEGLKKITPDGPPDQKEVRPATVQPKPTTAASAADLPLGLVSEKDAKILLKKAITFYFQEESGEERKRKVPDNPAIYGLSRIYRWGKLNLPPNTANVTQIEAPNQPKQNLITKLIDSKDFDTLIPEIEVNFLNREDFLYWLDAQYHVVQALEQKGGIAVESAMEIKIQLARLLKRLPALPKLVFKDKKTPFAKKETVNWIEDDVKNAFGDNKPQEKVLPPIMGEQYDDINKTYQKVCEELPENFEKNVKEMQSAIAGDTRPKGKFLRLLNLANYCYVAKKYSISKVLFSELMDKIDEYKIIEWEKALCVAVWQSTYMNNVKLLDSDLKSSQKEEIEKQQAQLFDRIGKYDSVLALSLSDIQQNKGE
jgi:type VI secretion system ImpA/VasJ family protein